MIKKGKFYPDFRESPPLEGSYRSIFKWGDPEEYKHPNSKLYELMKEEFDLTDEDFRNPRRVGDEKVELHDRPVTLDSRHLKWFEKLLGREWVSTGDYDRVRYSCGKTIEEAMELRRLEVAEITDCVLHPGDKEDVRRIVEYCDVHSIPLYVYGGGSSVNFGYRPVMGGVTLVTQTRMNRVIGFSEENRTCTVQAGILGPDYEAALNEAPERFGARYRYTNGHFPQSFEYSTVGGWITTFGSGQQSTYYGDACDLVVSQEYVTPVGVIKSREFIAEANGPRINDIMKGSEGTFGILVECTMKIFRYTPQNQFPFCYIFRSWEDGVNATREISQGEYGLPGVLRLSDPEETHVGLKLYGVDGTVLDTLMTLRGFRPGERCLLLGRTEGERGFSRHVRRLSKKICRRYGGMSLTGYPLKSWEHGRYRDPYLREDLADYGMVIDTLETSVRWDNIHRVREEVRKVVKARPKTICMAHSSHFYPQGTNLYFIYHTPVDDIREYVELQTAVIDAIYRAGGSLSHHHGVGRMIGPWMEDYHGKEVMEVLKTLKRHFDPRGILNPGGAMGLDYESDKLKNRNWRINWRKKV